MQVCFFLDINIIFAMMAPMKQLTNQDIEQMGTGTFVPDTRAVNREVRRQLNLGTLIPPQPVTTPREITIDLHHHTVDQAWDRINVAATSGAQYATIITGASGVLHTLFPQWATQSTLAPTILDWGPINNGSFRVHFRRPKE